MSSKLRVLIKLPFVVVAILGFCVCGYIIHLASRDLLKRRQRFIANTKFWGKVSLKVLGVQAHFENTPPKENTHLIIANHMGYLDVLVMMAYLDVVFVTSKEIQETPLLGTLAEMGGSLFIERRSRQNIKTEIQTVAKTLESGFNVVIFPEGTSTNGEQMLPFKKSFLVACAGTSATLLPTVINYRKVNKEPMSHKWRDHVCWYGDQSFLPSLLRLLSLKSIDAEVRFLNEIHVQNEDERKHVAELAQSQIEAHFVPILSPESDKEATA